MNYIINPNNSSVEFKVIKFGAVFQAGVFEKFEGEALIDKDNLKDSRILAKVDVGSIKTSAGLKLDDHLKSEDFFDVERYPLATFESDKVEKVNDNEYKVWGVLIIKDIKHKVQLNVVLDKDNNFSAKTELMAEDLKMQYPFEENYKIEIVIKGKLVPK